MPLDPSELAGVIRAAITRGAQEAFEDSLEYIERAAKNKLGTYQPGWPPLAESTLERRAARGWNPADEPLLETGVGRASIQHEVTEQRGLTLRGEVGSNEPRMVVHEHGSGHVPARPWLVPAAVESMPELETKFRVTIEDALDRAAGEG
jgi:hypothetical protein